MCISKIPFIFFSNKKINNFTGCLDFRFLFGLMKKEGKKRDE